MYSEEEILKRLKRKDDRCIRMMFDNYYRPLCLYALKFLASVDDAEDIVQDVFVSFWKTKNGTSFEGSLLAYLYGAVSKASLKFLDRNDKVYFDDIESHLNSLWEEISMFDEEEMNNLRNKLKHELDKLPDKCRKIFVSIVMDNLSYKEVAALYQVSVNTVKTHYSHALKKLREGLGERLLLLVFLQKVKI